MSARACILCPDESLCRLFETELLYAGAVGRVVEIPPTEELPDLLILDGDAYAAKLTVAYAYAYATGCALLVFGGEEPPLPLPPRGVFLRRPFSLVELGGHLRRLLERANTDGALPIEPPAPPPRSAAPLPPPPLLELRPDGTVLVEGYPLPLSPAETAILECLYARRGETVPRETLASLLEGGGNILDVYVCRLRRKIEKPLGRRLITTVRGVGYRLEL